MKLFFADKDGYLIDEESQTLKVGIQAQKVFTGALLRRLEYSVCGKILIITDTVARNVINETLWHGVAAVGEISVAGVAILGETCYYRVSVDSVSFGAVYYVFAGRGKDGGVWDDAECRRIIALLVALFSARGGNVGERDGLWEQATYPMDSVVDTAGFVRRFVTETGAERKCEVARLTESARVRKAALSRDIEGLRREIRQLEIGRSGAGIAEEISAERRKVVATQGMKRR